MLDAQKKRAEIIDHLERALALTVEVNQPITGYLIERALDEARDADWVEII